MIDPKGAFPYNENQLLLGWAGDGFEYRII